MTDLEQSIFQKSPSGWVTATMIAFSVGITKMKRKAPWLSKEPVGYGRKILPILESLCNMGLFEKREKPNRRYRRTNGVANNQFDLTQAKPSQVN